jgi:hypothetical protein
VYLFLRHFIRSFFCPLNLHLSFSLSVRMAATYRLQYGGARYQTTGLDILFENDGMFPDILPF